MDNLVSIIVPVYNNEKFLEKCLNSIINQSYKNLEIILINDGSTDDSRKICERFLSKDNRIKIINQKNSGVSVARNNGLRSATGGFVCFIDSDDYLESDYVEKMYGAFSKYDLVISEYYINSGDQEIHKSYDIKDVLNKKEFLEKISLDELYCGYLWNKIYKLSIIKENNIEFNPKINIMEDFLFNINYASFIQKVKVINKPLYHYLDNPNGALNSIKKK